MRRFAVGKPSDRPRWSPCSTTPSTRCARPSADRACATSPPSMQDRMNVALTTVSPKRARSTAFGDEPEALAELRQPLHRPGRLVTEPEIRTDNYLHGVQPIDENLPDEFGWLKVSNVHVELDHSHMVDSELSSQFGAAGDGCEDRWACVRAHDLGGVRIERQQHAGHPENSGAAHRTADDRRVPAVDTVESADRDYYGPERK